MTSTGRPALPAPGGARRLAVGGVLVAVAAVGGALTVTASAGSSDSTPAADRAGAAAPSAAASRPAPVRVAPAVPVAAVRHVQDGRVAWHRPLGVSVADGQIVDVTVLDAQGRARPGAVGGDGVWRSDGPLQPSSSYRVAARVRDTAGGERTLPLVARTTAAERVLETDLLSPGDGRVVGVGQPVRVVLDRPVDDPAGRAAVERRLRVATTPTVPGAWRWMSGTELHYRPADFWAPGTRVQVVADLNGLALPGATWGSGVRTTSFSVGDAVTSVVDVAAKTMTVSRNGRALRVMPASMGKPGFDTRGGTFLVLEKLEDKVMDSDTLALPAGESSYRTAVKHAVRITNSGTFTHGAPWSVWAQGRRNVSHGCINLSPANARWFFQQTRRGDVVKVVNAAVGPNDWDAGSQDWNMSFAQWRQGSALS